MTVLGSTRVAAVFGYPVSHSRSPQMHNAAFKALGLNWIYVPLRVDPAMIEQAVSSIRALDLLGANVTVPLKELVLPYLDWVDADASHINSVNTIVNDQGTLRGYSTDGPGLDWDLRDKGLLPQPGGGVLVLGAGGSARAVVYSLATAGYKISLSNRTREKAERLIVDLGVHGEIIGWESGELQEVSSAADLIINTTSVGLSSTDKSSLQEFPSLSMNSHTKLYDLVYSPPVTDLMRTVRQFGGQSYNGSGMLVRQGALSLSLWSGVPVSDLPIAEMERVIADV